MIDFECRIRRSPRRKTLSICVYPDNRVVVAAPVRVSEKEIMQFVQEKAAWVKKRMRINLGRKVEPRCFVSGETLLYLGREYRLKIEEGSGGDVRLDGGSVAVKVGAEQADEDRRRAVRRALIAWYSGRALATLGERCKIYMDRIGVRPKSVTVKSMKSRWGSCSMRGTISFAWNIIMAPEPVLDYLVVHELCHMVHPNHSAEYWKLVEKFSPGHREKRKWLKENGTLLRFD